jgi:hypothetical protein
MRQIESHPRMRAVRPIAISLAVAITALLIATMALRHADAQTSMGAPDALPAPTPPAPPPRTDYIPPAQPPLNQPPLNQPPLNQPPLNQPNPSTEIAWGAVGFTADGSYSTTWKMPSQPEAEARVAKGCAELGRGPCKVISFSGHRCVSLATFIRRRWSVSFTAGGESYPEAQNSALVSCNSDQRSQGRCQSRTTVCADGR